MKLEPGDVVQIHPAVPTFGGCFMVVTEVKAWGAVGDIQVPGRGAAPYRCENEAMERIGHAAWVEDGT